MAGGKVLPNDGSPRPSATQRQLLREDHAGLNSLTQGDARAELVFSNEAPESGDASGPGDSSRVAAMQCALRVGMLEAIPGLFGLLPARVSSSSCVSLGDDVCRYAIDWQRGSHVGFVVGGVSGALLAVVTLAVGLTSAAPATLTATLLALCCFALGLAAGRAFDLHRQLAAVAGARRGHLALFDQVDAVLAEKLDALSRLDATLEQGPLARRPERDATFDEDPLSFVDLRSLVVRAIEKVSAQVVDWAEIRFDCDERIRAVVCEPIQVERVVDELLQNAIEASLGAGESPEILVTLRDVSRGVELTIEDHGHGIDSNDLDETFDPFFDERPAGLDSGFGLPVCLRIIEAHGGELRIANPTRGGTRVTVLLPADETAETETRGN